jgi:hypothetical protein
MTECIAHALEDVILGAALHRRLALAGDGKGNYNFSSMRTFSASPAPD